MIEETQMSLEKAIIERIVSLIETGHLLVQWQRKVTLILLKQSKELLVD